MKKQEKKLIELTEKADECTTREEAQKILNKHQKARAKLMDKRLLDEQKKR